MALSVVPTPDRTTRLGAWVADQMRNRAMTMRDVERASNGLVSKATVSAITSGRFRAQRMSSSVAEGFALAFGVSVETVRELVGAQPGDPYIPPENARWLSESQRRAVDAVINAMLED